MKKTGTAWLALAVMGLLLVALAPHAALANHETNTTGDDETNDDDEDSGTGSTADDTTQGESGDYYTRLSSRDNDTEEDENSSTTTRRSTTSRTTTSTRISSLDDDEDGLTSGDEDMDTTGPITMAGSSPDAVAPVEHEGVLTFFVILLEDNEVRPATDREMDVMVDMLDSGESMLEDTVGDMEESATRPVPESVMTGTGSDGSATGSMGTDAIDDGARVDDSTGASRDDIAGESIDNEEDGLGTGTQDDGMTGSDDSGSLVS